MQELQDYELRLVEKLSQKDLSKNEFPEGRLHDDFPTEESLLHELPKDKLPANKFSDDNLSGHELQEGPIEDNGTRFWSGVQ